MTLRSLAPEVNDYILHLTRIIINLSVHGVNSELRSEKNCLLFELLCKDTGVSAWCVALRLTQTSTSHTETVQHVLVGSHSHTI